MGFQTLKAPVAALLAASQIATAEPQQNSLEKLSPPSRPDVKLAFEQHSTKELSAKIDISSLAKLFDTADFNTAAQTVEKLANTSPKETSQALFSIYDSYHNGTIDGRALEFLTAYFPAEVNKYTLQVAKECKQGEDQRDRAENWLRSLLVSGRNFGVRAAGVIAVAAIDPQDLPLDLRLSVRDLSEQEISAGPEYFIKHFIDHKHPSIAERAAYIIALRNKETDANSLGDAVRFANVTKQLDPLIGDNKELKTITQRGTQRAIKMERLAGEYFAPGENEHGRITERAILANFSADPAVYQLSQVRSLIRRDVEAPKFAQTLEYQILSTRNHFEAGLTPTAATEKAHQKWYVDTRAKASAVPFIGGHASILASNETIYENAHTKSWSKEDITKYVSQAGDKFLFGKKGLEDAVKIEAQLSHGRAELIRANDKTVESATTAKKAFLERIAYCPPVGSGHTYIVDAHGVENRVIITSAQPKDEYHRDSNSGWAVESVINGSEIARAFEKRHRTFPEYQVETGKPTDILCFTSCRVAINTDPTNPHFSPPGQSDLLNVIMQELNQIPDASRPIVVGCAEVAGYGITTVSNPLGGEFFSKTLGLSKDRGNASAPIKFDRVLESQRIPEGSKIVVFVPSEKFGSPWPIDGNHYFQVH